jgi:hypothetical protein
VICGGATSAKTGTAAAAADIYRGLLAAAAVGLQRRQRSSCVCAAAVAGDSDGGSRFLESLDVLGLDRDGGRQVQRRRVL